MATKRVPGRTRRESYSKPAMDAFPLCDRTSAPTRSCSKVIALIINLASSKAFLRGPSCPSWFKLFVSTKEYAEPCEKDSSPEPHRNPRPRRDARSSLRRLFASQPAADRVQVEP